MQTDDTLILADSAFVEAKKDAIKSAKMMNKARSHLTSTIPIKFNGTKIELALNGDLILNQKAYISGISLVKKVDASTTSFWGLVCIALSPKEQYVAQQAWGIYLASICQLEALFDLSYAAQSTDFF